MTGSVAREAAGTGALGTDFILVHGAWHGGWCWAQVCGLLEQAGHRVQAPCLPGLGRRRDELSGSVGLEAHVAALEACLDRSDRPLVVAHSYAGMPVRVLEDRWAERLGGVVYLEAMVPRDGEAAIDQVSAEKLAEWRARLRSPDDCRLPPTDPEAFGVTNVDVLEQLRARLSDHPWQTFVDRVRVTRPPSTSLLRWYLFASDRVPQPFQPLIDRLTAAPGWRVEGLPGGHEMMLENPSGLAACLLRLAGEVSRRGPGPAPRGRAAARAPFDVPLVLAGAPRMTVARRPIVDFRGETFATCAQAPRLQIVQAVRRCTGEGLQALHELADESLLSIFERAADRFEHADVGGVGPNTYVELVSRTTGLPVHLVRDNGLVLLAARLRAIRQTLDQESPDGSMAAFRNLAYRRNGKTIGLVPRGKNLSVVVPGNLPSSSMLWLTALGLRYPLFLRPSLEDPYTPLRLLGSLLDEGLPAAAASYLPCGHEEAHKLVHATDRSILFGGDEVQRAYRSLSTAKVYGPGRSKMIVGPSALDDLDRVADIIAHAMTSTGGRACIELSGVIVPARGAELAARVAERVADLRPLDPLDPAARLPAFADARTAAAIHAAITAHLGAGVTDHTAGESGSEFLVRDHGTTFLVPRVLRCDSVEHPLFGQEYPFPCVTIAEADVAAQPGAVGSSLVVSVLGAVPFERTLRLDPTIGKLYLDGRPTSDNDPTDPHEGFLTEFLYTSRAVDR